MQSSILLLWLSVLPMLASAGDPPPLSKSERTGTTNGHWWVEKGDFGPADYWQLIDPHRKVTPSVQEFLKNEYMEVDVKPACRNINCTALLIKVEFAISHKERITFEFNMVRQSLFVENKNIKDYFDLDCWFQQYNPLFGLEDYLRNNYRYVEKVAVAHYCFKRPSDYKRDFTLFFTYHDSYHFQRNGDVPDLLFHIEYLQDMRKFYAFQVLNPILKAWPSIQWEDISPEIERKKLYIKGTKLSPMLLTYDQEIILGPGDSPTTADAYHYDFLMTRAKLANLFNFHRRGPIGQQKKFVPYFKVLLVYRNFLNPIPKKWLDSEHNIVNLLYQADLMLRRLGIRFVVADQFVTSELFPNKPEFSEDNFCRTDALNDMPFSPIDHLFKYLEDTTKELNIDPFTFNAVLYIDPLFNNCDPKEMRKRYADTMQRRIGSKLAWLYSPTHPGRDISSDSTARPNVPAHTIYGLVKTLMFGNYKESTMCVFDGCPRHLVGQMYNANYASLRWDTHVFKEYEKRVPFYRSWLQPPPEYRWTESYQLCGDGLLQGEERCECNPNGCYYYSKSRQGVYRSTCCNRHTCKLNRGSSCGSGMCCDDESCSLIADEKHECRPPKDSCDAAEFCDGDNEECPPDLKWANGHSCDNGNVKSLCWNTVCAADYAQRCIQLHSTESKPDFSMWSKNTVGSELLNCGYDEKNRKFLPCDEKDKMCGAFHCSPIEYAPKTKGTTMFDMFTTVNKFTPLMMPNVTYCGLDSICLDTKCVHKKNLPQMVSQQCPFDCYGWGQCMYGGVCKCQSFDDFIDLKTCRRPVIAGALPTGKPALDENDEKQGKAETEGVETVATALFHSPSLIPWWFWLLLMLLLLFIIFLVFLTQRGRTEQTNVRLNPSTDQSSTVEAAKNAANLSPLPAPAMGSAVNRTPKKTPKPPLKTRIKEASVIPYSSTGFSTIAPAMTPSMTPSTGSFLSKSPDAIRDAKRKSTSRIPLIKSPLKMTNKTYVSNVSAISTSPVSRRK